MTLRKKNFFIVEDEDDHAELLIFNLEEAGVVKSIERARDGQAAVDYLFMCLNQGGALPDLVFLDLKLPKLNGVEVLEKIKKDSKLRQIPIVVLSTSASQQDQSSAYFAHANSFLTKPTDFDSYATMIADMVKYWCKWNQSP